MTIKGTWFDSFSYEGDNPSGEINVDVCNGTVFTNEQLEEAIINITQMANDTTSEPTKQLLLEIVDKAHFGIEIWK